MPVSPICLVADGLGPFLPTTGGVNVVQNHTISIRLNDTTGVVNWFLEVTGTDELSTVPSLTNVNPTTHQVTAPGATVTFTYPNARGRAILFQSTVTGPGGPVTTTFTIYTLTSINKRVGAAGEEREGNNSYGWITIVNPIIRLGAGALFYDDTLSSPLLGASTIQQAIDIIKSTPTFVAGGDLTGTATNQTVIGIQTRPVSSAAPGANTFLGWSGTQWAPLVVSFINGMPVPLSTTAHQGDFLRVAQSPFNETNGVIWDGSFLWVSNGARNTFLKVDTATVPPTLVKTFTTPQPTGTDAIVHAVDSTHVYVSSGSFGEQFYLINKVSGAVEGVIVPASPPDPPNYPGFFGATVNGDDIYIASGTSSNLAQIDRYSKSATLAAYPSAGVPAANFPAPDSSGFGQLVFGGGFLFSVTANPTLTGSAIRRHHPTTLAVVDSYSSIATTDYFERIHYAFGSLWLTRQLPAVFPFPPSVVVQRFNPASLSGGPTASVVLSSTFAIYITSDASTIWVGNGGTGLSRISTGVGTEAVIATVPSPDSNTGFQMAFDGTYIWVPESTPAGNGYGLRNCSTTLGSEAFVSLWQGPITLEYDTTFSPESDFGYVFGDPHPAARLTKLQGMPVATFNATVLPGSPLSAQNKFVLSSPQGVAADPITPVMWVADPNYYDFTVNAGQFGALLRIPDAGDAYPTAEPIYLSLLTNPFTALQPQRLFVDNTHVYFTTANQYVGILDKATTKLVGVLDVGGGEQPQSVIVNGNDIFVVIQFTTPEVQRFSKSAALAAGGTPIVAAATLPAPVGTDTLYDACFGNGNLFVTGTSPGPLARLLRIDPTGSMSIIETYTGGASLTGTNHCVFAFGSVWYTTGTPTVLRFDPTNLTLGPIATITTKLNQTNGITFDIPSSSIWVSDVGPLGLETIARLSTGLGTEAVTALVHGAGTNGLFDLAFHPSSAFIFAGTPNGEVLRFATNAGQESLDLVWTGPLDLTYQTGLLTYSFSGGATLSNFHRYVIFTPGSVPNGDTLFLPKNPLSGQQHTISIVGTGKGQLHGNGFNIDGLPSISFSTMSDVLSWNDTVDASITVTWNGSQWKIDAYGGSNPMLLGDVTGKQRRNRLTHLGPIGIPTLPLANVPGSTLGIGVGSQPNIIGTRGGETDIFRAGCRDFLRYDPTANPPGFIDSNVVRLPEKWSCTNVVGIGSGPYAGNYLVGDTDSGRLAVLEYPSTGDEPGIAQLYNLPYTRVEALCYFAGTGLYYVSSGAAAYLVTFDINTERFNEFSSTIGYNSLIDGGNGFLYGGTSNLSGNIAKIDPTTGDTTFVQCPDGAVAIVKILCKVGTKLVVLNPANQHFYLYSISTDTFDGVNFDLSPTSTFVTGGATNGTDLAFIGTGSGAGPVIFQVNLEGPPAIGTIITLPPNASVSGICYQVDALFAPSYLVSDSGRDLIIHVDSSTFKPIIETNLAGVLTVQGPQIIGDNGDGIRSGPARPFLADNQIGSLQAIFVHTPFVDGASIAGCDLVISERRLFYTGSVNYPVASTTTNGPFTPAVPGDGFVGCSVNSIAGFKPGMVVSITQVAPPKSGTFVVRSANLGVLQLGTLTFTGGGFFSDAQPVTFAGGPVEAQLYSTELAGHQTGLDYSLSADFDNPDQKNPTTLIGLGVPFNFFNLFSVGAAGATSNYAYETIHSTQNDSNIVWPSGGEDWTGARACYVYTNQETGPYGVFAELFFTAPNVQKLYQGNIFFDTGDPSFELFENEFPRAICAAGDNTFWVSFSGTGPVAPKIRKYQVTASGAARPTYEQVGDDVLLAGVVYELFFDGKYLWALSDDGTNGTIFKLDQSGKVVGNYVFTTGATTAQSRMCSDGSSVWITRGTVITRMYSEGPVLPLFDLNIPGGGFTQARGIVCDPYDKTIYVACYGTSLSIYAWYPPTGGWVESTRRRATWKTQAFGMPITFVATDIATLGPIGPRTTRTFEIDITATDGVDSGSWKKYVACYDDGTSLTIVGSAGDIMPPQLSTGAVSQGWDVTIATASSTYSSGTTLQVTITQGVGENPIDFTLDIKETCTYGGAL